MFRIKKDKLKMSYVLYDLSKKSFKKRFGFNVIISDDVDTTSIMQKKTQTQIKITIKLICIFKIFFVFLSAFLTLYLSHFKFCSQEISDLKAMILLITVITACISKIISCIYRYFLIKIFTILSPLIWW